MKDGKQDISFDRILMRIKDIVQITVAVISVLGSVLAFFYVGGKYIVRIDRAITVMERQANTLIRMQVRLEQMQDDINDIKRHGKKP